MRRSYLLAAAVLVASLSTASLLAGIRHALGKRETVKPMPTPSEEERRRIDEALGDMLAPPIDFNNWPEHLRPDPEMPNRDELRKSMPKLAPPLSQTIREDRDESRY